MKYFFYTILFVASLGTVGAIMNPTLVQQSAALVGLEFPLNSADTTENISGEDQLSQFLAQYPFAHGRNNAVNVPATTIPMAVLPEPTPSPIPPVYAAPVTPFQISAETVPPTHSDPAYASNWDSEATVPIYSAPVVEYFLPPVPVADGTIPPQSYLEPVPVPQQSIYAVVPQNIPNVISPQEIPPSMNNTIPNGFEQTKYVPQGTPPSQPPLPANGMLQTPAILIEDVPVYGTEMVARVGTQVILMGDILPKLRRTALKIVAENFKRMSEEDRTKVSQKEIEQVINAFAENHYPDILQEQILFALVYNDYDLSKSKAEKAFLNEKMGEEFDRIEVDEMKKEFNVENIAALKKYLEEQLGSSLDKERRFWIREQIVKQWIGGSVQRATGECTHDEMKEFYDKNQEMFTSSAQARWQEMVVLLSAHNTEPEALNKIRWMGNKVAGGAPFEEIAKANSDGFTASKGGIWDWTKKNSLSSTELEQAIFTQPVGQLSPAIIRSDKGFHIIRVLERQEEKIIPFVEAQVTIRERIKNQRGQRFQEEYFSDLRRRFPMVVIKDRVDFNVNSPRTASTVW